MKDKIRDFLQAEIDSEHIPGAVLHVTHRGENVLQEAIGHRTVFPERSPMKLDTVFDLASLTKVIATLPAVLKLIDRGAFRLDDPVSLFLPAFGQNGKEAVTIRYLLTHTSGLPAHRPLHLEAATTDEVMEKIYDEPLAYPSGHKVVYSDLNFITLYKVAGAVTGENFERFIAREVFMPLEMHETGFNPSFAKVRYAATEYNESLQAYKCGVVHDENAEAMDGVSGHAGLFSTMTDLQKFALMIENGGTYKGKRILSEAVLAMSRKNYTPFDSEYRGLGWVIKSPVYASCGDLFSDKACGHTGFTGTSMWFDPEAELHVILLTNRVHFGRHPHMNRLRPRLHNIIRSHI